MDDIELPKLERKNAVIEGKSSMFKNLLGFNIFENFQNLPNHVVKTDPEGCSLGNRLILKMRFKNLIINNKIQNVKLFSENIIKCAFNTSYGGIDAILSFNKEKCYIGVGSREMINNKYTHRLLKGDDNLFSLNKDGMNNCADRFGTNYLMTEKSQ